ncbi:MAG: ABC transporter ATP-binding protein [Actinobacteria bacterium]|nr:MAG: ABC transporter ATP-binding protein [Actinomycetota bacterium]
MSLAVDVGAQRGGFTLDAAFRADAGETVALLGPNGAGKSTLVDVLAGTLQPRRGRVTLDGEALDDDGIHVEASSRPLGVLFQRLLLLPHLSVLENVAFPLRARGMPATRARSVASETLQRTGAGAFASHRPGRLSGGEAQRVALARALVGDPRLLLLDEPLSALDVSAKTAIRALLGRELKTFGGVAIVITHDPVDAMTLAGRLVLIEGGRVTQSGTPEEIRVAPRTPYAADLVGVNLFAGRLERGSDGASIVTEDGVVACVAGPELRDGGDVLGIVRPADVSLHTARPEGSARNVFTGTVRFVSVDGERARIGIASGPPLVAEVTAASLRTLGLDEGSTVWASFKALEVRVVAA